MKKKPKIENIDFAKAVGKSSLLRIDWRSWKESLPPDGQDIWVVIKLKNGYYPTTATYFDETLPATKDGLIPKTRWRSVSFTEYGIPKIFVGMKDKNEKRLIAWGVHKGVVRLESNCSDCGKLKCDFLKCNCDQ